MTIVMLLEYARSGRSTCRAKNCKDNIEKGALRFGEPFGSNPHTGEPTNIGFRHWECMTPLLLKAVKQQGGAKSIAGFDKLFVEDQYIVMKTLNEPVPDVAAAKNEKRKRGDDSEEEASEDDTSKEAPAKKRKTNKGGKKKKTTTSTKEERASTSTHE